MDHLQHHGLRSRSQRHHCAHRRPLLPRPLQHLRFSFPTSLGVCPRQRHAFLEFLLLRMLPPSSHVTVADSNVQVHPTLKLPINALLLVGSIVTCLSLIYIASATAFNALISLQAFGLHISYFFPILFILLRKIRGPPPPYGPFKMGAYGVPVNIYALLYILFVIIWMPFPQVLPVTKDNMNYAGPIFGAVVLGAFVHWFAKARKTFKLPIIRYE